MEKIDISGCDKPDLLIALYNGATPLGLGFLRATDKPFTREMAEEMIAAAEVPPGPTFPGRIYFDYVAGRPLKVDLIGPMMDTGLYDRDQGEGKAALIVGTLLEKQKRLADGKGNA